MNIFFFLMWCVLCGMVVHADNQDVSTAQEHVRPIDRIQSQIRVLRLIVETRRCYFATAQLAADALGLLDRITQNLELLQGDRAYSEVTWFINQIGVTVGDVGIDVVNNRDVTPVIEALQWAAGVSTASLTRVPLAPAMCIILVEAIYKDFAAVLRMIPRMHSGLAEG